MVKFRWKNMDVTARRIRYHYSVQTPQGVLHCTPGQWLVRADDGRMYTVRDEVFRASFIPMDPQAKVMLMEAHNADVPT